MKPYLAYHFTTADEQTAEILLALLADYGFDTFDQNENELSAYIADDGAIKNEIAAYLIDLRQQFVFTYTQTEMEQKNWNEEWEKNFQPILIDNRCLIRAPFHPADKNAAFDLLIEPRMSFGTGHHESTHLMIQEILGFNFSGKTVCDAGCGTGILAILAAKKGADSVYAVDIEEWAYRNALDNIALNNVIDEVTVELGDFSLLQDKQFDIILANINKHIVLGNIQQFFRSTKPGGYLIISGILQNDLHDVEKEAGMHYFQLISTRSRQDWIAAVFQQV
jgi:ribosomal protein L11 methyltransferase